MKIVYALSFLAASIGFSAQAEEISAVCAAQASDYAFTKYADDDFDYVEAVSEASASDAVDQNNTGLTAEEIKWFEASRDSGEVEYYLVSAGGIGDYLHLLIYQKSDCSYLKTISVFEE